MRGLILIRSHRVCLNTGSFYFLPIQVCLHLLKQTCGLVMIPVWDLIFLCGIIFQILTPVKKRIGLVGALPPRRDILGFFPPLVNVQLRAAMMSPQRLSALQVKARRPRPIKAHLLGLLWQFSELNSKPVKNILLAQEFVVGEKQCCIRNWTLHWTH